MDDRKSARRGPQSPVGPTPGLLVYVPSVTLDRRGRRYRRFLEKLRSDPELQGWAFRTYDHSIKPWSHLRMKAVAEQLAVQIRTWAGEPFGPEGPKEIILVGHSIGGLLVRQAFLLELERTALKTEIPSNSWTSKVTRIALLASPNAGFQRNNLPWYLRGVMALASFGPYLTAEDIESGSDFITDLRLRWFSLWVKNLVARRDSNPPRVDDTKGADLPALPLVVQVLGDRDDLISTDDVLDAKYLPGTAQIAVPKAGHGDLVDLSRRATDDPDLRYRLLRHAIIGTLDSADFAAQGRKDEPVYILLHGIRSSRYGNWVRKLADALSDNPSSTTAPIVYAPSYGFFSAIEFALPWTRKQNMRHFLHWYGNYFVTHDADNMYFAGHSNGTYMLGRALLQVPSIRFRRIYLAASVLPRDFPWSTIVQRGQAGLAQETNPVNVIHCDRGSKDRPVGWLCSALNGLGMRDIGTGGYDGFDQSTAALFEHDQPFPGDHGAAFSPDVPRLRGLTRWNPRAVEQRQEESERISRARIRAISDFLKYGALEAEGSDALRTVESVRWFGRISRLLGTVSLPVVLGSGAVVTRVFIRAPSKVKKRIIAGAAAAWVAARTL